MKFAITKCVNGSFSIDSEWGENLTGAKTAFHGVCRALWNEPTAISSHVMIVNEQLDVVESYKEFIHHEASSAE